MPLFIVNKLNKFMWCVGYCICLQIMSYFSSLIIKLRNPIWFYKKCLQLPIFALWKGSQMGDNQT
jgi:hypothetical protein